MAKSTKIDLVIVDTKEVRSLEYGVALKIMTRSDNKGRWEVSKKSSGEFKGNEFTRKSSKGTNKETEE